MNSATRIPLLVGTTMGGCIYSSSEKERVVTSEQPIHPSLSRRKHPCGTDR